MHPVVLVHACMEARGYRNPARIEELIGMALREALDAIAIITLAGSGDPLAAWPSREELERVHAALTREWRHLHGLPRE